MISCPCGSTQPHAPMAQLVSASLSRPWWNPFAAPKLRVTVTGQVFACQVCGRAFAAGPDGLFQRAPNAMPFIPQRVEVKAPDEAPNGRIGMTEAEKIMKAQELRRGPMVPKDPPPW